MCANPPFKHLYIFLKFCHPSLPCENFCILGKISPLFAPDHCCPSMNQVHFAVESFWPCWLHWPLVGCHTSGACNRALQLLQACLISCDYSGASLQPEYYALPLQCEVRCQRIFFVFKLIWIHNYQLNTHNVSKLFPTHEGRHLLTIMWQ